MVVTSLAGVLNLFASSTAANNAVAFRFPIPLIADSSQLVASVNSLRVKYGAPHVKNTDLKI
jgi:hypothetical protein